jgi:hypothetical protein
MNVDKLSEHHDIEFFRVEQKKIKKKIISRLEKLVYESRQKLNYRRNVMNIKSLLVGLSLG